MVRRASLVVLLVVTAVAGQAATAVIEILNDRGGTVLLLNSWFPAWLAGTPSPGAATLVDRVDVTG